MKDKEKKGKGLLTAGIVMTIIGVLAFITLIVLSAVFYPPPDWPEGPPDPGPMAAIIADLLCSTCCLIGPVLLIIALATGKGAVKKKKDKKKGKGKKEEMKEE